MRRRARFVVLTTFIIAMAGCGRDRDTPTSPTRPVAPASPFIGLWLGTIVDSVAGSGTLHVTITEHVAISLLGTWTSAFADQSFNDSGSLTATADGSRVRLYLTGQLCNLPPSTPNARIVTITADLTVEGTRMSGGYIALGCGAPREGRIDVTKQ